MKNIPKYRVFKVSFNLPFIHYYVNSKVYKITKKSDLIFPIFIHSLTTILFGFFGTKMFKSCEALQINFSGGEDYSNSIVESEFDESINFVWKNLSRQTSERIDRHGIKLLFDFQEKYIHIYEDLFSQENILYLKNEMVRKSYSVLDEDIDDFFDSLKLWSQTNQKNLA